MDTPTAKEQSLFQAALEIEDAAEREEFLNGACAGDVALRGQILGLLAAHARSDRFFSSGLSKFIHQAAASPDEELAGTRIGRYNLLRKLGEGGCGVVYLAEQVKPVRRPVALKVIKFGMDTRSVIARFEVERQALALMDHPNIAKVLDAGATENGRPFFVMEYVQGFKITTFCDTHQFDTPKRLELFIQVCHAIQHAHQKGVIHRDIKPSNVLVTVTNDAPMPKVIDFGIAKATEGKLTDNTIFTVVGQFIGTPAYMSPEQAEMSGLDVDTRSDIYSLGVLLYELLTGRTPFDETKLLQSGFDEMRRTLREDDPQRPSALLTSLTNTDLTATAQHHRVEPPKLIKSVKGDLDWIVMKALEKDRGRRYETANGLAMDLQRYLHNEPVTARPPSQFYRLQKLVRRNKVVFASGAVVIATLVAGLGVSTHLLLREHEALEVQERLRREAEQARTESEQARANETLLRKRAEAREKVTQARVLVLRKNMQEADDLLAQVPADLLSPSMDAVAAFRELVIWDVMQARWKEAADRYAVLTQVDRVGKTGEPEAATTDLLMTTPLLIELGDIAGYDRLRKTKLDHLAGSANLIEAEHLIKTSLLLPADASVVEQLVPLGEMLATSLGNEVPNIQSIYAAWRPLALALLEYRRGDFVAATGWLDQCSEYPNQPMSCTAATHMLRAMALFQLGRKEDASVELNLGQEAIDAQFQKGLQWADNVSGSVPGWLHARILLREAAKTVKGMGAFQP